MAVEQTRTYELSLYLQDLDPSAVMISVDHPSWPRQRRLPLALLDTTGGTGAGLHIEKDILTGLSDHYVEVEFDLQFDSVPVGRKNLHVYRVVDLGGGKTVDLNIPIYGLGVTTLGFSFYIESTETLTGIVVEYLFI